MTTQTTTGNPAAERLREAIREGYKPREYDLDDALLRERRVGMRSAVSALLTPSIDVEAWVAGYVAGREEDQWRTDDEIAERAVDAICMLRMDATASEEEARP